MSEKFYCENYVCPKCGGPVQVSNILTNPPTTCYRCSACDYHYDDMPELVMRTIIAPAGDKNE